MLTTNSREQDEIFHHPKFHSSRFFGPQKAGQLIVLLYVYLQAYYSNSAHTLDSHKIKTNKRYGVDLRYAYFCATYDDKNKLPVPRVDNTNRATSEENSISTTIRNTIYKACTMLY
jgi:hypothetical protein